MRNVPDADRILDFIKQSGADRAAIIGAGFIGLELAENFSHRGIKVTVIEREPQVLPPLDPEMAAEIEAELSAHDIDVWTGKMVTRFENHGKVLVMTGGMRKQTDVTILSVGVLPESALAEQAGLKLGIRRSIAVDEQLRTSDPAIYAIGDAVEVTQTISGEETLLPLASPANRQGRMVADIISGIKRRYDGTLGTSIVKVFTLTAAMAGLNEKMLHRLNIPYRAVHISPPDHASYYPGNEAMTLKLLFSPESGELLGAQAVGKKGIDKTIDVLATAIHAQMKVDDLTGLELAYAPPYNSAKAPVNLLGYAAQNLLEGKTQSVQWNEIDQLIKQGSLLIDVRTEMEYKNGAIHGSVNIPLDDLRERMNEIPPHRNIIVTCQVGLRGYLAARILSQSGYHVRNLDGGYKLYKTVFPEKVEDRFIN